MVGAIMDCISGNMEVIKSGSLKAPRNDSEADWLFLDRVVFREEVDFFEAVLNKGDALRFEMFHVPLLSLKGVDVEGILASTEWKELLSLSTSKGSVMVSEVLEAIFLRNIKLVYTLCTIINQLSVSNY